MTFNWTLIVANSFSFYYYLFYSGSSERSAPPISLSSGMLDQLAWKPLLFTEMDQIAYDYDMDNIDQWPYNFTGQVE